MGNRTSQTAPSGTTPYTYDANNRLIQAGAVTYSYDANGNLASTSAGQSFSWNAFNRMTAASGPGGSVSYTYNGDGLKVRRTSPDGATVYYHDGIRPIWEADGAGTPRVQLDRDIFGNLLGRREVSSATRRYFAHDGLGGLTGVTDEAGTHVASLFYDAWGNTRATGGTWTAGNYRFTGAELDSATGLYHMGARFYDTAVGRWLREDPVQDNHFEPLTLNFYVYANNNPVLFTDPTGESIQEAVKAWLEHGEEYAKGRVKEVYAHMAEAYSFLEERMGMNRDLLVLGVLSSIGLAMMLNLPSPDTDFGKLVADYQRNPGNWRVSHMWTETSRTYRGAYSTKFIFQRVSDGAVIWLSYYCSGRQDGNSVALRPGAA